MKEKTIFKASRFGLAAVFGIFAGFAAFGVEYTWLGEAVSPEFALDLSEGEEIDVSGEAVSPEFALDLSDGPIVFSDIVELPVDYGTSLFTNETRRCRVMLDGRQLAISNEPELSVITQKLDRAGTYEFKAVNADRTEEISASVVIDGPEAPTFSPEGGYTFTDSMNLTITRPTEDSVIYYTLDGSEPTDQSPILSKKKMTITEKTVIKAIAVVEGRPWSKTVTAAYATGTSETPVISPADGTEFDAENFPVTITWNQADGDLYYTLNGGEPTKDSIRYTGPFTISYSRSVKAKVLSDHFFDSETVEAKLTRIWYNTPDPEISPEGGAFAAAYREVMLSCENEDAAIYYTLDGSDPKKSVQRYTGPIRIYRSCTVRAVALADGFTWSGVVSAAFTKNDALGAALNCDRLLPTTDSGSPWVIDSAVSADGVSSLKSAAITDLCSTWLEVALEGEGDISFMWKTSCEEEDDGDFYDYCSFAIDGVVKARKAGINDWEKANFTITGEGTHTLRWVYSKDDSMKEGQDCAWVDSLSWRPKGETATYSSYVPVPYAWLDQYGLAETTDYESAANALSGKKDVFGNNLPIYADYVMGTDPTDANSKLEVDIEMDGENPVISWLPNLGEARKYTVYGTKTLGEGCKWEVVNGNAGDYNFFKVTVEMK